MPGYHLDGRVMPCDGDQTMVFCSERPGRYRKWRANRPMLEFPELPFDYMEDLGTVDLSSDELCADIQGKGCDNYYKFHVYKNWGGGLDLHLYANGHRRGQHYILQMPAECPAYLRDDQIDSYPQPVHFYVATGKTYQRTLSPEPPVVVYEHDYIEDYRWPAIVEIEVDEAIGEEVPDEIGEPIAAAENAPIDDDNTPMVGTAAVALRRRSARAMQGEV